MYSKCFLGQWFGCESGQNCSRIAYKGKIQKSWFLCETNINKYLSNYKQKKMKLKLF